MFEEWELKTAEQAEQLATEQQNVFVANLHARLERFAGRILTDEVRTELIDIVLEEVYCDSSGMNFVRVTDYSYGEDDG
jgi:hypothetical protein